MAIDNLVKNQKGFTLIELMVCGAVATVGVATLVGIGVLAYLGIRALSGSSSKPDKPAIYKPMAEKRLDVIAGPEPELFMEKGSKRFYAEIDGNPVESYFEQD